MIESASLQHDKRKAVRLSVRIDSSDASGHILTVHHDAAAPAVEGHLESVRCRHRRSLTAAGGVLRVSGTRRPNELVRNQVCRLRRVPCPARSAGV